VVHFLVLRTFSPGPAVSYSYSLTRLSICRLDAPPLPPSLYLATEHMPNAVGIAPFSLLSVDVFSPFFSIFPDIPFLTQLSMEVEVQIDRPRLFMSFLTMAAPPSSFPPSPLITALFSSFRAIVGGDSFPLRFPFPPLPSCAPPFVRFDSRDRRRGPRIFPLRIIALSSRWSWFRVSSVSHHP